MGLWGFRSQTQKIKSERYIFILLKTSAFSNYNTHVKISGDIRYCIDFFVNINHEASTNTGFMKWKEIPPIQECYITQIN